jgi:beta-xylosidase
LKPLFDYPVRDTSICRGPDDAYYLTGTTGAPDWWSVTANIQVWKSSDLQRWTPVVTQPRDRSVVWNIDRDGTWQKQVNSRNGGDFRPLWSPEIHYIKGTFWITYSIPGLGSGLLRSTSGQAEGPYVSALAADQPIANATDASLFADDDGKVYFVCTDGNIALMNDTMTRLVEPLRHLAPADAPRVGTEGAFLFKANGRYHLAVAHFLSGYYDCYVASSDSVYGPYGDRYLAIPHGGHCTFFQDAEGQWWATFFGNDRDAPFRDRPTAMRIGFGPDGRIRPLVRSSGP